jgi:2-oxoglutarate/2-oxoacid ferredoxin oxidoreductase subunit beta
MVSALARGRAMKQVYARPRYLKATPFHYCAGCGHSIAHRLVAEVLEELEAADRAVGVAPAGCAVLAYHYLDFDMLEAAHGRGAAVATGLKRRLPENVIFTYQGDGDLAAIGTAETIHAAARGEKITVLFINNAIYGMTGGQLAPTTLPGMRATTAPLGRDVRREGHPLDISRLVAEIPGASYVVRVAVTSPKKIVQAKKAISEAFRSQMAGEGFGLVEILSPCPTNWKMSPVEAARWAETELVKHFPLGVLADRRTGVRSGGS